MGIHEGHRERLRTRFLKQGLECFEEHSALELLLFYARPRCDTNAIAHALIQHFGSFAEVLDAPLEELVKINGVGESTAILLKTIAPMGAYYLNSRMATGVVLDTSQKAGEYFVPKFFGKNTEEFYMAALDDKKKVLRCSCLSDNGIPNAVAISVKRIVAEAVNTNATSVLLAHNHPRGLALPSGNDRMVTSQAKQALHFIHVDLLDHIIITDEEFVSMADSGFLTDKENEK